MRRARIGLAAAVVPLLLATAARWSRCGREGSCRRPVAFQPMPEFSRLLDDADEFQQAVDVAATSAALLSLTRRARWVGLTLPMGGGTSHPGFAGGPQCRGGVMPTTSSVNTAPGRSAPGGAPAGSDADRPVIDLEPTGHGDRGDPGHRRAGRSLAAWCVQHRWRTLSAALLVLAGAVVLVGSGITATSATDQMVGDSNEQTLVLAVGLDAQQNADGTTDAGARTPGDVVGPMMAATERLAAAHPDLKIGQVGPGSIDKQVMGQLDTDFRRAELFSLPVTLAVLLIAFGAVVAAGVPVLLGIGAVVTALGLTAFASHQITPVDQNTQSLVLLIGLAVGVDYALFVIRRSREERAAGAGATLVRGVMLPAVLALLGRRAHTGPRWIPVLHH